LDHYLAHHPRLLEDREALEEVAFEEFQQRRRHGEAVTPEEYRTRYRVDVQSWQGNAPGGKRKVESAEEGGISPPFLVPSATCRVMPPCPLVELPSPDTSQEHVSVSDENQLQPILDSFGPALGSLEPLRDLALSPKIVDQLARAARTLPGVGSDYLGFHLIDELGRGAFGRVFLAQQRDLANRPVALKVATDLLGEPQMLAKLQHTNIVPVYSVHHAPPFHAVCMPYFGSTTLADVTRHLSHRAGIPTSGKYFVSTLDELRQRTQTRRTNNSVLPEAQPREADTAVGPVGNPSDQAPVPGLDQPADRPLLETLEGYSYVESVLWIGLRLSEGLAHAHERGILHRDLKPANVLLTDDGQPMLLDFNLSEDTRDRSGAALARMGGTLPYMSPEHLEAFVGGRQPIDPRSDLFSLGLILFELLTGRFPYPTRTGLLQEMLARMLEDRRSVLPRLRPHNKQVSPAVESIIRHCLQPDPARRYQSARQLQEDLQRHLQHLPLRYAPEPSLRERLGKWSRQHPRLSSTTTLGLVVGLVGMVLATTVTASQVRFHRGEALEGLHSFREDVQQARFLLSHANPDRQQIEEGADLCQRALARYGIPDDPAWREGRLVRHLPSPEHRQSLHQDIDDALLLWARATTLLTHREKDAFRRRDKANLGFRLLDMAEQQPASERGTRAARLERAELLQALGRRDEAHAQFLEAERVPPQTAQDFFLLGRRHCDARAFDKAVPLLDEATTLQPQNALAWACLGYCHLELGHPVEAIRCYTAGIALSDRSRTLAHLHYNRGLAWLRNGSPDRAERDLDEAIRLQPRVATFLVGRGNLYHLTGRHREAVADFTAALEVDPAQTRLYFLRSRAHAASGNKRAAARDHERGLQEEPTDELSWIERALARVETAPAAALADLEKALELNPRSLLALQNKAHVLGDRLGKPDQSLQALGVLLESHPHYVPARIGRGVLLARLGQRDQAHEDARTSLARDHKATTLYQAANIYALTSRTNPPDRFLAYAFLALALQGGFGLDVIDADSDMDPIRKDREFRRIVSEARERVVRGKGG
jgi:serine/threonine protein kinase/Tfp pilus assembly protein PilF